MSCAPSSADRPVSEVCAIIVTFKPDTNLLERNVSSVLNQVGHVVIVSNDSDILMQQELDKVLLRQTSKLPGRTKIDTSTLILNGKNRGISAAYNLGIRRATELGYRFVLLLDQDSCLDHEAVQGLLEAFRTVSLRFKVGAVSAHREEQEPRATRGRRLLELLCYLPIRRLQTPHWKLEHVGEVAEISTFANSGTIIPVSCFTEVGDFDERLFVDAVDVNMSLRLGMAHYRLFSSPTAKAYHRAGIPLYLSWFGKSIPVNTQSPERSGIGLRDVVTFTRIWFRRYPAPVLMFAFFHLGFLVWSLLVFPGRYQRAHAYLEAMLPMD